MLRDVVAVTGAAGFIGSNLCRALRDEGYRVVGIDDLSAGTRENVPDGIEFVKMDILDPALEGHLRGAQSIFHLAAKNCLADCAAHPVDTARVNVTGTASVLEASRKAGVPHLIYADTSAEYEGIEEFPSKTELVRPLSIYACSKRGGALIAQGFSEYYGLQVSTVRYFNVYGPAQDWRRVIPPVMSAFTIKLLSRERPFIYGTGEKRRDFIHVDDVNRFHLMLLREPRLRGGTYNLGSGQDYSIREVYDLIEREIGSGLSPQMKPDLPAEAFRTLADISKTLETGWRPQVGLREGIQSFIQYTRERLQLEPLPR